MTITFSDAGKRFNREWIFRRLSYQFNAGNTYAITGANGSGKSTLLQVIAGHLEASAGNVIWENAGKKIPPDQVYTHLSIAAPYLDLIEEMTAHEFLSFHHRFKPLQFPVDHVLEIIGLQKSAGKQVRYFSSGMKQRLKLAQSILANVVLLLLDEPCTNLDAAGIELYHQLIKNYAGGKTIIVSSNDPVEYNFCLHHLSIMDYK